MTDLMTVVDVAPLWRGTHELRPGWRIRFGYFPIGRDLYTLLEGRVGPYLPGLHLLQPGPHQMAHDLDFLLWEVLIRMMAPRCGAKGRRYDPEE